MKKWSKRILMVICILKMYTYSNIKCFHHQICVWRSRHTNLVLPVLSISRKKSRFCLHEYLFSAILNKLTEVSDHVHAPFFYGLAKVSKEGNWRFPLWLSQWIRRLWISLSDSECTLALNSKIIEIFIFCNFINM